MPEKSSFFIETHFPHQKNYDGITFPAVLTPSNTASNLVEAVAEEKPWLESLLHRHGAVLFRGFGSLTTAKDFNDVVEAFGYDELPYIGGAAPRHIVYGRVYTANDGPSEKPIPLHHELAQVSKYPSKLFFFCEVPPAEGGETPIALSHLIYDKMKNKHPEFVENLEKLGLIYIRAMTEEDNKSTPAGRGWKSTFLTEEKSVAEEKAAAMGVKLEWKEDLAVMITGPIPGIKYDEKRERKIWFNSITIAYIYCVANGVDRSKAVTFGDGTPIPTYAIEDCIKFLEEETVTIPWERGDVLLVDNFAALHSRKPYTPPRRILASLCI